MPSRNGVTPCQPALILVLFDLGMPLLTTFSGRTHNVLGWRKDRMTSQLNDSLTIHRRWRWTHSLSTIRSVVTSSRSTLQGPTSQEPTPKHKTPSVKPGVFDWGRRIRTLTYGSRDRCPTVRRAPKNNLYILPYPQISTSPRSHRLLGFNLSVRPAVAP